MEFNANKFLKSKKRLQEKCSRPKKLHRHGTGTVCSSPPTYSSSCSLKMLLISVLAEILVQSFFM